MDTKLTFFDFESDKPIWSMEVPYGNIIEGIMYGVFYGIKDVPNRQDYGFIKEDEEDDYYAKVRYGEYARLLNLRSNTDPDKALEASIANSPQMGIYHIVLRSLTINDPELAAVETVSDAASYVQGIMSGLQLYNIPLSEVLLKLPYGRLYGKTGFYKIQGYDLT